MEEDQATLKEQNPFKNRAILFKNTPNTFCFCKNRKNNKGIIIRGKSQ